MEDWPNNTTGGNNLSVPTIQWDHRSSPKCNKCRQDKQACLYGGYQADDRRSTWAVGRVCDRCLKTSWNMKDDNVAAACSREAPQRVPVSSERRTSRRNSRTQLGSPSQTLQSQDVPSSPFTSFETSTQTQFWTEIASPQTPESHSASLSPMSGVFFHESSPIPNVDPATVTEILRPESNAVLPSIAGRIHDQRGASLAVEPETPFNSPVSPHPPSPGLNDRLQERGQRPQLHQPISKPHLQRSQSNRQRASQSSARSRNRSESTKNVEPEFSERLRKLYDLVSQYKRAGHTHIAEVCLNNCISLLEGLALDLSLTGNPSSREILQTTGKPVHICQANLLPNIKQPCGNTNFLLTVISGEISSIQHMLATFSGAVDLEALTADLLPVTALVIAARRGRLDIAKLLLDNGASVNGSTGVTNALHEAITHCHVEMISLLLERKADPNMKVALHDDQTALDRAISSGDARILNPFSKFYPFLNVAAGSTNFP